MKKVLVLCTHNSVRSQLTEAIFRHLGSGKIEVKSAGSEPKTVHRFVYSVLEEAGINHKGLDSKDVRKFLNEEFDYIITVCDNMNQVCPVFPGKGKRIHWSLDDPSALKLSEEEIVMSFRKTRDIIKAIAVKFLNVDMLKANFKCPICGQIETIKIPKDKCLVFYKCNKCNNIVSPTRGSCCVICSYTDKVCGEFLKHIVQKYQIPSL